ncbi:hypothetical protein [Rhizobium sp. RAF56]|uniref:hypothetical protein n=1 Tax=Rhizobium sp. RAF56 TaxID=3233062 RepID=UPI003F97F95D
MVEVVTVSAYTAAWAMDAAKQPARVPTAIAAREARRMELRQKRREAGDAEVEAIVPAVQSTALALELMIEGERQPQSTMQQAITSYEENS